MNAKQLITLVAIASAGTAAMAEDITIANESFVVTHSRADVRADVLKAHAAGVAQFSTEVDAQAGPALPDAKSTLTREQVRAELRNAPRSKVMIFNPAA